MSPEELQASCQVRGRGHEESRGKSGGSSTIGADPESLTSQDFIRAGTYLGAAANKLGLITQDLTQYMNRILKITLGTHTTASTKDTLPALVLDCEDTGHVYGPPDETDLNPEDPPYSETCAIYDAHAGLENYEHFPDVQELFVDFGALGDEPYYRAEWRGEEFPELILPATPEEDNEQWWLEEDVTVLPWLQIVNGPVEESGDPIPMNIDALVAASSDAVRTIEFIHNYAVPVVLPFE